MYKNILVPLDLNHETSWRGALATAVELARCFAARVNLVSVIRDVDVIIAKYYPPAYERIVHDVEGYLSDVLERSVPQNVAGKWLAVRGSSIYAEILKAAIELGSDLIVMGSHRPEMKDYLLGSNAAQVVRHAKCSVLVVRTASQ